MALLFEHGYLCRNCEDEFGGYPAGFRLSDALPLCGRCTELGMEEGVAAHSGQQVALPAVNNGGIAKIGILVIVFVFALALVVYAALSSEGLR